MTPEEAPTTAAAEAVSAEWMRCCAHLPRDVFDALSDDVMFRSDPDPAADGGVHGSFLFDEGQTLVSYRDGHAVVARRADDGSSVVIVYRDGAETERRTVPAAAIAPDIDPTLN